MNIEVKDTVKTRSPRSLTADEMQLLEKLNLGLEVDEKARELWEMSSTPYTKPPMKSTVRFTLFCVAIAMAIAAPAFFGLSTANTGLHTLGVFLTIAFKTVLAGWYATMTVIIILNEDSILTAQALSTFILKKDRFTRIMSSVRFWPIAGALLLTGSVYSSILLIMLLAGEAICHVIVQIKFNSLGEKIKQARLEELNQNLLN